ncbi:vascular cell adhesion protein 1-like isoform X2 [Pseudophryne corroboree]|uniref:vascular cell adhesion protein 1-like isoform X2 n=1 Tax=Pseudophryne corroboree TaxID=495146 RepID=UPI0030812B3C
MSRTNVLPIASIIFLLQIIPTHTSASDITLSLPHTIISAQIGEELHITCEANTCEKPGFIWANLVDSTLSGTVSTVGQKSTLTMKVNSESDGSYRCTVSCNKPPPEKSFKIAVYSFPSDPILDMSSAVVGEQSRITCTLTNIYRSEMMTAKIMLDTEIVVEYNGAEVDEYDQKIKNISFWHDLILEESYEAKKIECVAEMEFQEEDEIDPIIRQTSIDLHLKYPPAKPQIRTHPSTTVRAGEEISLTCSCDSASQAYIQWLKLVDGRKLEMPTDDQGILTLSSAEPQDSGIYICCAKNDVGETSSQVEITVQGLPEIPKITIQPGARVTAGQTVTIECFANGNRNTNVTLWKVSEELDILLHGTEGKFFIKEAAPSDTAEYRCTAENHYGLADTSESLTVTYPPRETVLSSSAVDVKEGDTVTLSCASKGDPKPSISLYKLLLSGESLLLSEGPVVTLTLLTSGIYQCHASNVLGRQEDTLELKVRVPPKNTHVTITPSPVVREGDSVQITCTSEASPAPSLVLYIRTENGLVELESESGEYNVSHAGAGDIGTYICESKNVVGQQIAETPLTVQVPPKNTHVTITPSPVVREGDSVQITCTSEASTAPSLVLYIRTENGLVELESESGEYNVSHAGAGDIGTYICESTNVVGQQIAETPLTVQVPPKNTHVTITPSPVVREGDSVQITCTSEASPAPSLVLYIRTENGLVELKSESGEYNVSHAGAGDIGTYICDSKNVVGQQIAETPLTVQVPHRNTTVVVIPSQNITEGDTVIITLRQPKPNFNPISVIIGSVAFVSAGIIGAAIYLLKQAKVQGSYSLVKALKNTV